MSRREKKARFYKTAFLRALKSIAFDFKETKTRYVLPGSFFPSFITHLACCNANYGLLFGETKKGQNHAY